MEGNWLQIVMQKIFAVFAFTEEGGRKKEKAFLCDQGKSASEHN